MNARLSLLLLASTVSAFPILENRPTQKSIPRALSTSISTTAPAACVGVSTAVVTVTRFFDITTSAAATADNEPAPTSVAIGTSGYYLILFGISK